MQRGLHHLQGMAGIGVGGARHKGRAGGDGLFERIDGMIKRAPRIRLALESQGRGGGGLFFGQAVNPVVHDNERHLDVPARGVAEMIAADGKRIAVPTEGEDVQIGSGQGNAGGKGQRAPMKEVNAMRLHKIGKPAGTADSGDADDFLVMQPGLLNELEEHRQNREIAASGTPSRVIRGEFFFGERLAVFGGGRGPGSFTSGGRHERQGVEWGTRG